MSWQDDPILKAAAWEGIASNLAMPIADRLGAALEAIKILHKRIEELEEAAETRRLDDQQAMEREEP